MKIETYFVGWIALALGFAGLFTTHAEDKRPNVLFIAIDDLNDWTGFLGGHPEAFTPHMDTLAKRGRNFTNAHCSIPVCSASRASVMSGVAATTTGSYELGPRYEELPALTNLPTIQGYFKEHGYTSLEGGKVLHHGFTADWLAISTDPRAQEKPSTEETDE